MKQIGRSPRSKILSILNVVSCHLSCHKINYSKKILVIVDVDQHSQLSNTLILIYSIKAAYKIKTKQINTELHEKKYTKPNANH